MKIVALALVLLLLGPSDAVAAVHRLAASLQQYPVPRRSPPYVGRVSTAHRGYYWTMSEKKAVRDFYEGVLLCSMTVGTQEGLFQVRIDTTSDQSWLFSDDVLVPSDGYVRQTYLPENSSTFVNASRKFSTLDESGWQASDAWKIPLTNLSARIDFGVATRVSRLALIFFYSLLADGQLGLAPGVGNQSFLRKFALSSTTRWSRFGSQRKSPPNVRRPDYRKFFSNDAAEPSKPAVITFGAFDTDNCDMGTAVNATHKPKAEWAFRFDALDIVSDSGHSESLNISATAKIELLGADILAPNATLQRIAALLGAEPYRDGAYTIDCAKRRTGQTLRFRIGDGVVDISPEDYVYRKYGVPDCKLAFMEYGETTRRNADETWSVGSRFFNSHCVYLDYERDVLGFAKSSRKDLRTL